MDNVSLREQILVQLFTQEAKGDPITSELVGGIEEKIQTIIGEMAAIDLSNKRRIESSAYIGSSRFNR